MTELTAKLEPDARSLLRASRRDRIRASRLFLSATAMQREAGEVKEWSAHEFEEVLLRVTPNLETRISRFPTVAIGRR